MKLPVKYKSLSPIERRNVREKYRELQGDFCMFCKRALTETPDMDMNINWKLFPGGRDFLKYPVHLQHCHKTGLTEGAVHAYCNAVLWQYYDR